MGKKTNKADPVPASAPGTATMEAGIMTTLGIPVTVVKVEITKERSFTVKGNDTHARIVVKEGVTMPEYLDEAYLVLVGLPRDMPGVEVPRSWERMTDEKLAAFKADAEAEVAAVVKAIEDGTRCVVKDIQAAHEARVKKATDQCARDKKATIEAHLDSGKPPETELGKDPEADEDADDEDEDAEGAGDKDADAEGTGL